MLSSIRKILLMDRHTCPWWLAYSWDHRLRTLIQDPDRIIRPYVREGDRVLDVGCGMGFFSIAMAGYVGPSGVVYALDIQQKMLDVLMRRARARGAELPIRPVLAGGARLPVPEKVDFVLAFWMLHEVEDREGLLKDLTGVLKENGLFLLVEPRVHVRAGVFEEELAMCSRAGLTRSEKPRVAMSRAMLFTKPGR
jgi:ubiquinone/menaquinone biosynthesis C-methylase UbiE